TESSLGGKPLHLAEQPIEGGAPVFYRHEARAHSPALRVHGDVTDLGLDAHAAEIVELHGERQRLTDARLGPQAEQDAAAAQVDRGGALFAFSVEGGEIEPGAETAARAPIAADQPADGVEHLL